MHATGVAMEKDALVPADFAVKGFSFKRQPAACLTVRDFTKKKYKDWKYSFAAESLYEQRQGTSGLLNFSLAVEPWAQRWFDGMEIRSGQGVGQIKDEKFLSSTKCPFPENYFLLPFSNRKAILVMNDC